MGGAAGTGATPAEGEAVMAEHQRPIWRGHLRLALVSCPVALYSARHAAAELHFHFINPKTGNRVRMETLDAETGKEVQRGDLVKGYEFKKDTYVLLDDADFERAKIDSSTVLSIDKFVASDEIDPVYYDNSYFMVPDGEAGEDVYAVLREAIGKTGRVALSRLVIARRERAVAIMPMERGMVLHTLHDPKELHDPQEHFAGLKGIKLDTAMVKLATQLIDRQTTRFDLSDMEDRYEARLREVIEAKLRGEEEPEPTAEPERDNVIDLMTALKRSLGEDKAPARRAAKRKPASKAKAPAARKSAARRRA
jgi:DNA end-binding protein Ku